MSLLKRAWLKAALALLSLSSAAQEPLGLLPTRSSDPAHWGSFISCIQTLEGWVGPNIPDWMVHSCALSYASRRPLYDELGKPLLEEGGRQRTVPAHQSGRIFFPPAWRAGQGASMPIVVYSHATSLLKDAVPSEFSGHEWIFAAAAASYYGFAVAMPDEPGMGSDGTTFHPYCHARSLAYAVVDAIPAAVDRFRGDSYAAMNSFRWDGRVFLVGYSEGGLATLAAAREMETHRADFAGEGGFILAGSACMAGPFDLSGTLRNQMVDPKASFPHAFFIPYILLGYNAVYGRVLDPLEALAPALLETREDGNILEWSNGATDGPVVDQRIARRLGTEPGKTPPLALFNPAWVARELSDPAYATSTLRGLLEENDPSRGWTPTRPILFAQSPDDRDVLLQNALSAHRILGQALWKAGRDPLELLELRLLGEPGNAISHAEGVLMAIPLAFDWIYRQTLATARR
jgi:hypothetical protein